jgi:hypothetical protein
MEPQEVLDIATTLDVTQQQYDFLSHQMTKTNQIPTVIGLNLKNKNLMTKIVQHNTMSSIG